MSDIDVKSSYTRPEINWAQEKDDKIYYKFNESDLLKELSEYIGGTYTKHYVGPDNIQAFELIASAGHGIGFTIGDIIKYAARYGKKNGRNRDDLLKILHYGILALYIHDKETNNGN